MEMSTITEVSEDVLSNVNQILSTWWSSSRCVVFFFKRLCHFVVAVDVFNTADDYLLSTFSNIQYSIFLFEY